MKNDHDHFSDVDIERLVRLDSDLEADDTHRDLAAEVTVTDAEPLPEVQKAVRSLAFIHRIQASSPHCVDDLAAAEVATWLHVEGEHPTRIGRHQIRRRLGSGGFGVVFLAFDPELEREVALKVPRVETLINGQTRRRFLRESKMAAQLDHQNIATIYEAGTVGPIFYIASEFCPGGSLDDYLQAKQPPARLQPAAAAHVMAAVADAVQHAHDSGILHRDIKPSNVLLDVAPEKLPQLESEPIEFAAVARLVDFGLAKNREVGEDETKSGILLGTPAYTAPEVVLDRPNVGVAADVYSLGATLYHILTGEPPHKKASDFETLIAGQNEEPLAPSRLVASIPRDLDAICLKCLAKEPERRYRSAADLADDLRNHLNRRPIAARHSTRLERIGRWCRRNLLLATMIASTAILLFVAGSSLFYTWQFVRSQRRLSERIQRELDSVSERYNFERQHFVVGTASEGEGNAAVQPTFDAAPNGQLVAIGNRQQIDVWDLRTGKRESLTGGGKFLAFANGGRDLFTVDHQDRLTQFKFGIHEVDGKPWVNIEAPDESTVVNNLVITSSIVARHGVDGMIAMTDRQHRIVVVDANSSSPPRELDWEFPSAMAFSPAGDFLAIALPAEEKILMVHAATDQVLKRLAATQPKALNYSPDGNWLAVVEQDFVRLWNLTTESHTDLMAAGLSCPHVAFSPNGRVLAYAPLDDVLELAEIDSATMTSQRLTSVSVHTDDSILAIYFSDDGQRILAGTQKGQIHYWELGPIYEELRPRSGKWELLQPNP